MKPIARKKNIVVQNANNEVLVYDLNINRVFCLNETTALVWEHCDGNQTIEEISLALGKELDFPIRENFVWLILDKLKKVNLLENGDQLKPSFVTMSRREIIKKVGLSSMIALPTIVELVAPTASQAASGRRPSGSLCSTNSQCTSNCCASTFPTALPGIPAAPPTCIVSGQPLGSGCFAPCSCASGNCATNGFGVNVCS